MTYEEALNKSAVKFAQQAYSNYMNGSMQPWYEVRLSPAAAVLAIVFDKDEYEVFEELNKAASLEFDKALPVPEMQ